LHFGRANSRPNDEAPPHVRPMTDVRTHDGDAASPTPDSAAGPDAAYWETMVEVARALVARLRGFENTVRRGDGDGGSDGGGGGGCGSGESGSDEKRDAAAEAAAAEAAAAAAARILTALEEVTALVEDDEEFVAALGAAHGHGVLMRLVSHEDESVVAAAADAMCACTAACPPGRAGEIKPAESSIALSSLVYGVEYHPQTWHAISARLRCQP
jgi:hypothetical protein